MSASEPCTLDASPFDLIGNEDFFEFRTGAPGLISAVAADMGRWLSAARGPVERHERHAGLLGATDRTADRRRIQGARDDDIRPAVQEIFDIGGLAAESLSAMLTTHTTLTPAAGPWIFASAFM